MTGRRRALLLVVALLAVAVGSVGGAGGAQADQSPFDASLGDGGFVALDWTRPAPTTLVGTNGVVVAASVGDQFGITGTPQNPLGNVTNRSVLGFGKPAVARGMTDGLVVGRAGDDFGLARFLSAGRADFRFGTLGRTTIGFGGPAEAWSAAYTWDDYGWVVAGSAKIGPSRRVALARVSEGGYLSSTFGSGGKVTLDLGPGDDEARAVTVDHGPSPIVAGRAGGAAFVARLRGNGTLDPSFANGGVLRLDLTSGDDIANSIAFDPYGSLMIGGRAGTKAFVTRLSWDGVVDTTYGHEGTVFFSFGGDTSEVRALRRIVSGDSTVIVAGTTTGPGGTDAAAAKLTATGHLDTGFGDGGVARADFGGDHDEVNALSIPYEGNAITVLGGDGERGVMWHLTADGQPDTAAAPDGRRIVDMGGPTGDRERAAAIDASGRTVIAGQAGDALALARLRPDGSPDPTFGDDGLVVGDLGTAHPAAVAVAPDGGVVVWGWRPCPTTGDGCAYLARFRPDGQLDRSFAGNGAIEVFAQPGWGHSLLVQPDGKIVAAGTNRFGTSGGQAWLARWRPDGTPDPTFGTDGVVVSSSSGSAAFGVVRLADGSLVLVSSGYPWAVAGAVRYDSGGREIGFFGPFPQELTDGMDVVATPDGGLVVVGVGRKGTRVSTIVARMGPDGRPDLGFGDGGVVEFDDDVHGVVPGRLAVLADGRVAVSMSFLEQGPEWTSLVTALGADGEVDPSFGDGGFVAVPGFAMIGPVLAAQSPGRLLVLTSEGMDDAGDIIVSAIDVWASGGGGGADSGSGGWPGGGSGGPGPGGSGNGAGGGGGLSGAAFRPTTGYWMVTAAGQVFAFGSAVHLGEPAGRLGKARAVDLEPTPDGGGYWVLDSTGEVHAFGNAAPLGRVVSSALVVGEEPTSLSATPSGAGYWIFTTRGRVVPFGDAGFFGDVSNVALNGKVLGSVATPSGKGYYMVAADGGIFTFGDATFHGSTGNLRLNKPVMGMAPAADGSGYWLVAADGGVFAFGVPFRGSMGGTRLNQPITGMVPGGDGYLMVAADGGVFSFGTVPFFGSLGANPPKSPVVAAALRRS